MFQEASSRQYFCFSNWHCCCRTAFCSTVIWFQTRIMASDVLSSGCRLSIISCLKRKQPSKGLVGGAVVEPHPEFFWISMEQLEIFQYDYKLEGTQRQITLRRVTFSLPFTPHASNIIICVNFTTNFNVFAKVFPFFSFLDFIIVFPQDKIRKSLMLKALIQEQNSMACLSQNSGDGGETDKIKVPPFLLFLIGKRQYLFSILESAQKQSLRGQIVIIARKDQPRIYFEPRAFQNSINQLFVLLFQVRLSTVCKWEIYECQGVFKYYLFVNPSHSQFQKRLLYFLTYNSTKHKQNYRISQQNSMSHCVQPTLCSILIKMDKIFSYIEFTH